MVIAMAETDGEMARIDTVRDIEHYDGDKDCGYQCGDDAQFLVTASTATKKVKFLGCRSCLNEAKIYPYDNEWLSPEVEA